MAMSSQFYRDISKIEKKVMGISFRHFKAYALLTGLVVVLTIEVLLLPDWAFFIASMATIVLLGTYPVLLLFNQWKAKKRRIELHFLYQERVYYTGQIRRYGKHEFIQEKGIKETDSI